MGSEIGISPQSDGCAVKKDRVLRVGEDITIPRLTVCAAREREKRNRAPVRRVVQRGSEVGHVELKSAFDGRKGS